MVAISRTQRRKSTLILWSVVCVFITSSLFVWSLSILYGNALHLAWFLFNSEWSLTFKWPSHSFRMAFQISYGN